MRNLLRSLALVVGAGVIAALIVLRVTSGGPGAAASTSVNHFNPNSLTSTGSTSPPSIERWHDDGDGHFMGMWGPRAAGTVKQVSDDTLTIATKDGKTVTVSVSSSTTYMKGTTSSSLSEIKPGDEVFVRGTQSTNGTIAATRVMILPPTVFGTVTEVNGNTITVKTPDGATHTVQVNSGTKYGDSGSLSQVVKGSQIEAEGSLSNGTLNATNVRVEQPRVFGTVASVSGSSFTVTTKAFGSTSSQTVTVNTSGSTKYDSKSGASASLSSVTKGATVVVEGTLGSDGKTMQASRVLILPAFGGLQNHFFRGSLRFHGFMPGFGHMRGMDGSFPGMSPPSSSNGPSV